MKEENDSELSYFNNEQLNITLLIEECSEVIQVLSKIQRFGLSSFNPDNYTTNKELLERELADVLLLIRILINNEVVSPDNIENYMDLKVDKLKKFYKRKEDD